MSVGPQRSPGRSRDLSISRVRFRGCRIRDARRDFPLVQPGPSPATRSMTLSGGGSLRAGWNSKRTAAGRGDGQNVAGSDFDLRLAAEVFDDLAAGALQRILSARTRCAAVQA